MTVGDRILRVCRATNRVLAKRLSGASDYSYLQLRALRIIDEEGIRTQVALGERLHIDAPSVSRLVDRLEKEGLLQRKDGDDRRSVCLTVTATGRKELRPMSEAISALDETVSSRLSKAEAKTLAELLEKVQSALDA